MVFNRLLGHRSKVSGLWLPALVVVCACANPVAAEDLPALRQGMWEFQRTVGSQKISNKECVNPTKDMKQKNAQFEKQGCRISPLKRKGNAYTFTADCLIRTESGQMNSHTTSVITVESDRAYTVQVEGAINGKPVKERLTARRISDCKE